MRETHIDGVLGERTVSEGALPRGGDGEVFEWHAAKITYLLTFVGI